MSTLKRKHSSDLDSGSSSEGNDPYAFRSTHIKRRRYDLAGNLSQLSLFENAHSQNATQQAFQRPIVSSTIQDVNISPWSASNAQTTLDADGDVAILDVVHPIVEEPADIPEVRMHHVSSYEPEKDRIVITDLDSSSDESETPPHTPAGDQSPYSVSSAFLSRIKVSSAATVPVSPIPVSDPSRALVLFKPSPWVAKNPRELEGIYQARDASPEPDASKVSEPDDDAMEIE